MPPALPAAVTPALGATGDPVAPILAWIGALVAAVVLATLALVWLRRRLDPRNEPEADHGIDLATLRRLHAAGELTDEQFEAAKATVVRTLAGDARAPHPHADALRPRVRRAEPGLDLTGEPLPGPGAGEHGPDDGAGDDPERPPPGAPG
jgi:hypothetical protein